MTENVFNLIPQNLTEKLNSMNITEPTKVQQKVIPILMERKNLVFQSETGTGKTFAYLLPLIKKLQEEAETENKNEKHVKIIICAPTFELSSQIKMAVQSISSIKTALFIGGSPNSSPLISPRPLNRVVSLSFPSSFCALSRLSSE